jgi:hypothetical protein
MTDWLSSRCGVSWGTARHWVTVSRALRDLPRITDAYERGRLTWDQLLPAVRLASPEDDAHWAEAAPTMYPSQLWREHERRQRMNLRDEREAHASRYLSITHDHERPVVYLEGRLGREQGAALEAAIKARAEGIVLGDEPDDPKGARMADALMELATDGARATVVIHASAGLLTRHVPRSGPWLAETADGHRLHGETIRRLACDGAIEWLWERDGRLGLGRKSRQVPAHLERAVRFRDCGTCRFAGCERKMNLRSHHIVHWADGGGTDLDNLVTLCGAHHRLIHEGGWRISGHPRADLRFHDPTGRALERASPPGLILAGSLTGGG